MIGIVNATSEWLFDRHVSNQAGLFSAVISAKGQHSEMDNESLIKQVANELSELFHWPQPDKAFVIREKRATICCKTNIDKFRPPIHTPVNNLKLCGDYVYIESNNQAGLPSTLEGALRSGVKCAQQLIQELN